MRHDPDALRIYAADDGILDVISGDVHTAGHAVWRDEHISNIDAKATIRAALAAILLGEQELDRAVLQALAKQLSWAKFL